MAPKSECGTRVASALSGTTKSLNLGREPFLFRLPRVAYSIEDEDIGGLSRLYAGVVEQQVIPISIAS